MKFKIPETFSQFSIAGLEDLKAQAEHEYTTLKESVSPDTVTREELDHLKALKTFIKETMPGEFTARASRKDEFAALDDEPGDDEEKEAVTASASNEVIEVRISDISDAAPKPQIPEDSRPRYSTLVASAGVPNYEAGQPFSDMLDVAKAFEARSASHGALGRNVGAGPISYPVAQLVRNYPDEFSVFGDERDYEKLLKVSDETRLPGGNLIDAVELRRKEIQEAGGRGDALVAAAGWCAPSETDYSICLQISTDGLYDAPEVQARRGGIRSNSGIEFDSIFGGGTGYFNLTEAEVAAATVKTCLEIPCPNFTDTRLGVTGLCLTGNILSIRGYPEFTAAFTRGALAASAHQINREQIADVVAGSTAVTLTGGVWTSDGSVVSNVLSAVELAIVDIKYRLRMQRSTTLEVVMPWWVLAQMRADWVRRNGTGAGAEAITLADAAISAAFSARGARVQYVYDWQDAFASGVASGSPGADTPITLLPTSLQFLVYPAGTWVRAVSDVITLNSVYDSTKLATNQVTHLFTETGWAMIKMCPVSRVYTVPISPIGATGNQKAIA